MNNGTYKKVINFMFRLSVLFKFKFVHYFLFQVFFSDVRLNFTVATVEQVQSKVFYQVEKLSCSIRSDSKIKEDNFFLKSKSCHTTMVITL